MKRGVRRLRLTADQLGAAGLAAFGGGLVWYAVLMRRVLAAASYGPICGHASLFAPHCPPCYAALGMVGAGLGLLALAEARRGRAASQRAR
jgi:hypothetical protein